MNYRYPAPVPEVHYLPSLFRRIQNGEIKIPAFQRGIVWKGSDVLALMESIYRGYPVGSLLFWKAEQGTLKEHAESLATNNNPSNKNNSVLYVLDGMQRLTTLYSVFQINRLENEIFEVAYDFIEDRFYHPIEEGGLRNDSLLLSSLFNPKELLHFQSKILNNNNADTIISKSIELQSVFQEYLIPTVTIYEREIPDVVEIFKRVNSTGVKLNIVDFMRALTWSGQFDLNDQINNLKLQSKSMGFNFDDAGPTLVKYVAIHANMETTALGMFKMRELSASELNSAVSNAQDSLPLVFEFIKNSCQIENENLLGYEGQFLIAAAAIKTADKNPGLNFPSVVKLIWQIGFEEILRGKQDHFLERILKKIYEGNWSSRIFDLNFDSNSFLKRRFLSGKALTASFTCMYTAHAREIFENQFSLDDNFSPILRIDKKFGETRSDRVFVNLINSFGLVETNQAFDGIAGFADYVHAMPIDFRDKWCKANFIDPLFNYYNEEDLFNKRLRAMNLYATSLMQ